MGSPVLLVTASFCIIVNLFAMLVSLLVAGQLDNLALELLDGLEEDFHGG